MRVLLLAGGISDEHDVSMASGDKVEAALRDAGHAVVRADPSAAEFDLAVLTRGVDVVFLALHGLGGEDGTLQKQLEGLHVPFVGSDSKSSKLCFDKVAYKQPLAEAGIVTPKWEVITPDSFTISPLAKQPFVLKPLEGGSSIDTFVVRDPKQLPDELLGALQRYKKMLLEELIDGPEITVGVLLEESLPVLLIIPPAGEGFDYENKYNGKTQEIVNPPQLPADLQEQAREIALKVHNLVGCSALSRTDMMIDKDNQIYVLETNTIPGLTGESLFPKMAAAAGVDFDELIKKLISAAHPE